MAAGRRADGADVTICCHRYLISTSCRRARGVPYSPCNIRIPDKTFKLKRGHQMNLQAKLIASVLCVGALPFTAQAADFEDFGRVVRVTPQVEQINRPRQECRTEYVQV